MPYPSNTEWKHGNTTSQIHNFSLSQGAMDIKYLQERYQKGKVFVTDFMNKAHRCPGLPLSQAHADLLQHQRDAERNDKLFGY